MTDKLARDLEATLETYAASAPAPRDLATAAKQRHRRRQRRRTALVSAAGAVVVVAGGGAMLTQGFVGQAENASSAQAGTTPGSADSREALTAAEGTPEDMFSSKTAVVAPEGDALAGALTAEPARAAELLPAGGATVSSAEVCRMLTDAAPTGASPSGATPPSSGYAVSQAVPCLVLPLAASPAKSPELQGAGEATCDGQPVRWVIVTAQGRREVSGSACGPNTLELVIPQAS